jgi:ATP-dependent Lhr-like helicase
VEEVPTKGDVRWPSDAIAYSYELCRAQRDVLLGVDPEVTLSQRAKESLPRLRAERAEEVSDNGLVLRRRPAGGSRLWTWAGLRANATLLAGLGLDVTDAENESVLLPNGLGPSEIRSADPGAVPRLEAEAITALKFSAALPVDLAARTLGERLADPDGAASVVHAPLTRRDGTSDSQ